MLERMLNSRLAQWLDDRTHVVQYIRFHLIDYPTPKNLNYWYAFGSIALVVLIIQVLSGVFLAMDYKPAAVPTGNGFSMAFDSIERIMREVNDGWLIRYMHAVGASAFFFVIYLHMARGMYYGSYKKPREFLWIMGVLILVIMQATVFFGYLLPWGQMSFWGATVITNIFGAIPGIGDWLLQLVRGGYGVGDVTLNRFFALHFLFPFLLFAVVFWHVMALHVVHSNNPEGIEPGEKGIIPFHPYYTVKDLFGIGVFLIVYSWFVFFDPTGHGLIIETNNFNPADPLKTPPDITPVWYLTPWYEILRSVPNKLLGIVGMAFAYVCLFLMPWLDRSPVRSARYRPVYRVMLFVFFASIGVLGYCGHHEVTPELLLIGRIASLVYFAFFALLPFVHKFEKTRPVPEEI